MGEQQDKPKPSIKDISVPREKPKREEKGPSVVDPTHSMYIAWLQKSKEERNRRMGTGIFGSPYPLNPNHNFNDMSGGRGV